MSIGAKESWNGSKQIIIIGTGDGKSWTRNLIDVVKWFRIVCNLIKVQYGLKRIKI